MRTTSVTIHGALSVYLYARTGEMFESATDMAIEQIMKDFPGVYCSIIEKPYLHDENGIVYEIRKKYFRVTSLAKTKTVFCNIPILEKYPVISIHHVPKHTKSVNDKKDAGQISIFDDL